MYCALLLCSNTCICATISISFLYDCTEMELRYMGLYMCVCSFFFFYLEFVKQFMLLQLFHQKKCLKWIKKMYGCRSELCPEKRMLFYPNLPKVIGSDLLEASLRKIHGPNGNPSACHVFGHTHFCWDSVLDGIR